MNVNVTSRFEKFDEILRTSATAEKYVELLAVQHGIADMMIVSALAEIERGNWQEAEHMLEEASKSIGGCPQALYNLGRLQLDRRVRNRALRMFEHAIELEPEFPLALFTCAVTHLNVAEDVHRSGVLDPASRETICQTHLRRAENILVEALVLLPDDVPALTRLWGVFMCQGRCEDAGRAFSQIKNIDTEYGQQLEQHCLKQGYPIDARSSPPLRNLGPSDLYINRNERLGDTELLYQAQRYREAAIKYFLLDETVLPRSRDGTWKIQDDTLIFCSSNPRMGKLICRKMPLRASANRVGDIELTWSSPRFRVAAATKGFIYPSEVVKTYRKPEPALANHHASLKLSADQRLKVIQPRNVVAPTEWKWLLGFRKVQGPNLDVLLLALPKSEWTQHLSRKVAAGLTRKHLQDLAVFQQTNLEFTSKFRECYGMKRRLVRAWKRFCEYANIDNLPQMAINWLERLGNQLEKRASVPYRDAGPWNAVLDCVRLDLDLRQDWLPRNMADDYDFATPEGTAQWLNSLLPLMKQRKLSIDSMADLFARWLIQIDFDECYRIVTPELDLLLILESFHLSVAYPELTTVLAAEAQREYGINEDAWLETSFFMHSNMAYHCLEGSADSEINPEFDYYTQRLYLSFATLTGCEISQTPENPKNRIKQIAHIIVAPESTRFSSRTI